MLSRVSGVHTVVPLRKLYPPGRAGVRGARCGCGGRNQRGEIRQLFKTARGDGAVRAQMGAEELEAEILESLTATELDLRSAVTEISDPVLLQFTRALQRSNRYQYPTEENHAPSNT